MTAYDTRHNPPAPVAPVTVANMVQRRRHRSSPALLDTGSDITAIPRSLANTLRLYPIGQIRLEDVQAQTIQVLTYAVQLRARQRITSRIEQAGLPCPAAWEPPLLRELILLRALTVADLIIPRLEVILTDLDHVVLGRDVLNLLYILLSGPEAAFDMHTTPWVSPATTKAPLDDP